MNLREAAQQALEAMACMRDMVAHPDNLQFIDNAITALRTALAEPETEAETYKRLYELRGKALERPCSHCGYKPEKIYPMEQRTEPEQEPVAWKDTTYGNLHHQNFGGCIPLYTHPPQRKPLTDEEIVDLWADVSIDYDDQINIIEMARAIERAHGIGGEA